MSNNAILITGDTYVHRRALRGFGCLFDRSEMGYIVSSENEQARKYAEENDLDVADYEASEEQLTPATGERLRAIRQDQVDRRRDRLLNRADSADRRAERQRNRVSKQERNFLALAEPVKVGHHSERRHRKLIDRALDSAINAGRENAKADKLRSQADFLRPAQIKGDAEREREKLRAYIDRTVSVGDLVKCSHYGESIVLKINKKTVRVRVQRTGSEMTYEKHFIVLVEKRDPEQKPKPKFKKDDRVLVRPWDHRPMERGVILRRTPNGYSVEFTWRLGRNGQERTSKQTFQESEIELDAEETA